MPLTSQSNKEGMGSSYVVVFTSSPSQFDCSDKEISTLAYYGFTFSNMHMKDRRTKVVSFSRCPKRVDCLPDDFISAIGENYIFISD